MKIPACIIFFFPANNQQYITVIQKNDEQNASFLSFEGIFIFIK
jgi:hypothetical protein